MITLGIIGVVAALTIPTLISKFEKKVLKTRFVKSYAVLSEALTRTKIDLGENLVSTYAYYDYNISQYVRAKEFTDTFFKHSNFIKEIKPYDISNYNNTVQCINIHEGSDTLVDYPNPIYLLKDGTSIRTLITSSKIFIDFDTNGPKQGPNRYGWDVFRVQVDSRTDGIMLSKMERLYTEEEMEELCKTDPFCEVRGMPCSKFSTQGVNGEGCAWYAYNDINPDDNSKGYWESLK